MVRGSEREITSSRLRGIEASVRWCLKLRHVEILLVSLKMENPGVPPRVGLKMKNPIIKVSVKLAPRPPHSSPLRFADLPYHLHSPGPVDHHPVHPWTELLLQKKGVEKIVRIFSFSFYLQAILKLSYSVVFNSESKSIFSWYWCLRN